MGLVLVLDVVVNRVRKEETVVIVVLAATVLVVVRKWETAGIVVCTGVVLSHVTTMSQKANGCLTIFLQRKSFCIEEGLTRHSEKHSFSNLTFSHLSDATAGRNNIMTKINFMTSFPKTFLCSVY